MVILGRIRQLGFIEDKNIVIGDNLFIGFGVLGSRRRC